MKKLGLLTIILVALTCTSFGQNAGETVTKISKVKDVQASDTFYKDLQSLIETYGIAHLTTGYKFNPAQRLNTVDYAKIIEQGKKHLKFVASDFGLNKVDDKMLFGTLCQFSKPLYQTIPEKDAVEHLKCFYRIDHLSIDATDKAITRGKFATFLNKALQQASFENSLDQQAKSITDNLFSGGSTPPAKPAPTPAQKTAPLPKPTSSPTSQINWTTHLKAGTDKMTKKDYAGAVVSYSECLKLADQAVLCFKNRAMSYYFLKKYDLALTDINEAIKISADNPELYNIRGFIKFNNDDALGASVDLDRAVTLDPQNPEWYANRAIINCKIKEFRFMAEIDEEKVRQLGGKVVKPCK